MKRLNCSVFRVRFNVNLILIISCLMLSMLISCAGNIFTLQPQNTSQSLVVIYIEVTQKINKKSDNLGRPSTLLLHIGDKIYKVNSGKQIVKESDVRIYGLEYTQSLSQEPITDNKLIDTFSFGQGKIIVIVGIPPGKFNITKIKLPSIIANNRIYRRWLSIKKFSMDVLPASINFLGSYRFIMRNNIEERYDPNGDVNIYLHENSKTVINNDFGYEILAQPGEKEIIKQLSEKVKGTKWEQLIQDRIEKIGNYKKSGILSIDHLNMDNDSIIKQQIEILSGGTDINTKEIKTAMGILDWYGPLAIERLLTVFDNKDKSDVKNLIRRLNAIAVFDMIGNKRSVDLLKKIAGDGSLNIQEKKSAKEALQNIENQRILYQNHAIRYFNNINDAVVYAFGARLGEYKKKSIDFLIKSLDSYNYEVRLDALAAMIELNCQINTNRIVKMLKDDNEDVRLNASALLTVYKDKNSISALIEALKDPSSSVKMNVIKTLLTIGNHSMIKYMKFLKDDPDELVKNAADRAISIFEILK